MKSHSLLAFAALTICAVPSVLLAQAPSRTLALNPSQSPAAEAPSPLNKMAPDWELMDVNGKKVKLSDFKGRVVILDFWATWCVPCLKEVPGFIALQSKYGDKGLTVIGVSEDGRGPDVIKSFTDTQKVNYPIVLGNPTTTQPYGNPDDFPLPATFIIDRSGKVVAQHFEFTSREEFEKDIIPLLEAK